MSIVITCTGDTLPENLTNNAIHALRHFWEIGKAIGQNTYRPEGIEYETRLDAAIPNVLITTAARNSATVSLLAGIQITTHNKELGYTITFDINPYGGCESVNVIRIECDDFQMTVAGLFQILGSWLSVFVAPFAMKVQAN